MCKKDGFDPAPPDPDARICPAAAHIRKAYPRDDERETESGNPLGSKSR